jgi:hypothetical protein|tara:strand:+ start:447 stop:593 length:147 start_codon:yes stop_codon:yes gene_type:complete
MAIMKGNDDRAAVRKVFDSWYKEKLGIGKDEEPPKPSSTRTRDGFITA